MKIVIKTEGLVELLAKLNGAGAKIHKAWRRTASETGEEALDVIRREFRTAPDGETTPTATAVRTGQLRKAYDKKVTDILGGIALDIGLIKPGTDKKVLKYGWVQEFGKVIRAVNGKYLTIPLKAMKTDARTARMSARDARKAWDTFVVWGGVMGPGGGIIYRKDGNKIIPLFVLKEKVTVPPRPTMEPIERRYTPILETRATKALVDLVA